MLLKGKTIFIVEDNRANASIMLTALQLEGAKTHLSGWGKDAIKIMQKADAIDLILVDLMLPRGLTGYDVYDTIRTSENYANIPVAIVSASDANLEMRKAKEKGFVGYISKPINFLSFPRIVAHLIEGYEFWADESAIL